MKVTARHQYTASVEDIYAFFASETTVNDKYEALGSRKFRIKDLTTGPDTLTIDSRREVPVGDEIPAMLKKFAGEWNRVRQRENWNKNSDGSYSCKLRIDIDGVPVKINGDMTLQPEENGCVNIVDIEINSSVPLVGKALAEFVGQNTEQQMESEYQYIRSTSEK
ncbi:MAG: hypothetical protein B0D91_01070 [Oceanospirillales bacterium LUC14_002_19_P2]|nr:MAG: hypothetical protein B0D91_01070 [Oceanospirillales bacterium LUC14_002_19_P2]